MTDPPLGRCPVHPEKDAWRVCGRCGRFLCAICTVPTAAGPHCEACRALLPAVAEGFSALMVLAIVGLISWPALTAVELEDALAQGTQWSELSVQWLLTSVPVSLLALCTLPLYVMKKRIARRLMVAFYVAAILVAVVDLADDRTAAMRIGVGLAWLGYFGGSERVKRVLVR